MNGIRENQMCESVLNASQRIGIDQKKKCSKCRQTKILTKFPKNKNPKDKHGSWCKSCVAKNTKKWAAANHEKAKKNSRGWIAANYEKVKAWRKANPEKYRNICRKSELKKKKCKMITYDGGYTKNILRTK